MTDTLYSAPPGIDTLIRALDEAGVKDVSWSTQAGHSAAAVFIHAWANREDEAQGATAARRGLYDLAEQTITLAEHIGLAHVFPPTIVIAHAAKHDHLGQPQAGYELTLTLALRPAGAPTTTPAVPTRVYEHHDQPEPGTPPTEDHPWSTELHQDGQVIASGTAATVGDALWAARTGVGTAASDSRPWRLDVRGPNGAQATFRALAGFEAAARATTWHEVRDAYWDEIKQPDRPGDGQR